MSMVSVGAIPGALVAGCEYLFVHFCQLFPSDRVAGWVEGMLREINRLTQ